MLNESLEHLRESHPEESQFLQSLANIEEQLDLLIAQQQNCVLYDPGSQLSRIRIQVYNTFADQGRRHPGTLFSHVPPARYTLHIRAFELDADNKVVDARSPGLLTKYFRTILIDTPSGVVVWDRDDIISQKAKIFNQHGRPQGEGGSGPGAGGHACANHAPRPGAPGHPEFGSVEGRDVVQSIHNGFDELHVNRLGFEECDVCIYFFPAQLLPVYSLSKQLCEFIKAHALDHAGLYPQANLPKITRAIWSYAFQKRLFVESGEEVFLTLDEGLRQLLRLDAPRVNICQIPLLLKPHLLPPLPLKIVHHVKLKGEPKDNERVFDITLESCFSNAFRGAEAPTELDVQIAAAEGEVIELIHLRNIYATFSRDPHKFISSFVENKNLENYKPFLPCKLDQKEHYRDPWVHYAIENYLYSNNRTLHDFVSRIMERGPGEQARRAGRGV